MRLASSSYYYRPVTDMEARERSEIELRDHIVQFFSNETKSRNEVSRDF